MRKTKEELIAIYEDTKSLAYKYDEPLSAKIHNIRHNYVELLNEIVGKYEKPNIIVENIDCVKAAGKLANQTCILNMASYKHPGGGVTKGTMSQEEELARRSMLMKGLPDKFYPLQLSHFIYTEHVVFFKDQDYFVMQDFPCDVITIAAVNLNGTDIKFDEWEKLTRLKIQAILYEPHVHGCENLVLSAFGCGVFKNDPNIVAKIFKEELDKGFANLYENVVFAIYNDHNSVSDNFQIFKNTLDVIR